MKTGNARLFSQTKSRKAPSERLQTLFCLPADVAINKNEVQNWTKTTNENSEKDIGRLIVLPSTRIGSDQYTQQKMEGIIAIFSSIAHHEVSITVTCNPRWPEIQSSLFPEQISRYLVNRVSANLLLLTSCLVQRKVLGLRSQE